ncbi:MAG: DUF5317 domain-containing protein [Actinomycetota bacterium]
MLGLSPLVVLLGLLAGLARGGRVSNIALSRFRAPWLVLSGLLIQATGTVMALAAPDTGRRLYIWFLGASFALLIAFALTNLRLSGMVIIAAGLAMNAAVILLNDGMPVLRRAAEIAGLRADKYLRLGVKHRAMGPDTVAGFFGDVIPVPVLKKVISAGDVLIGAGMFVLVDALVRYAPRRRESKGA